LVNTPLVYKTVYPEEYQWDFLVIPVGYV